MQNSSQKPARVAIIGPENVSASDAYALLVAGFVKELVLVGKGANRLIAELDALQRFVAFPYPYRVWKGNYDDAARSAIVVICIGDPLGRSHKNSRAMVRGAAMRLKDAGFAGVLLVTRDPVNILGPAALEASGLPPSKVLGLGTGHAADRSGRFTFCTARRSGVTFMDNCNADCPYFEETLAQPGVAHPTQRELRSYSPENVATCVTQICDAVINDTHAVIPVFVQNGSEEFHDLPCSIGKDGVIQIVRMPKNRAKPVQHRQTSRQVTQ